MTAERGDLPDFAATRVLVVGDVMLDRYWFGDVRRISPEAPVPVISVSGNEERAGGAANVARNVAALGARCTLLSVVGEDEAGASLSRILDADHIEHQLFVDANMATTVKLRILSRNQQLLRADFERQPHYEVLAQCLASFESCLAGSDVVILSDYGKGGLVHVASMIAKAREAGVPVVVDPKGRDFSRYRGATMLTPNVGEFEAAVGECATGEALAEQAGALLEALDVEHLLITRSELGMSLYSRGGAVLHSRARAREVYDVSGAGDTVIAVMATALATGVPHGLTLDLANTAAGLVVARLGTAVATRAELEAELGTGGPSP